MNIAQVVCMAVLIGLSVGTALAIGISKLLKRERESLPCVGSSADCDGEPYPRWYE